MAEPRLTLASRSPQRRAILEQLGVTFEVVAPEVEEIEAGDPLEVALQNAQAKARAVDAPFVLAADTVVALEGQIYGQPAGPEEARNTLAALSGRVHKVVGGLCLVRDGQARTATAVTSVRFRALDERLIDWYVSCGEWRERAGGYAIQGRGAALVVEVEGDYLNVVGLPLAALLDLAPDLLGPRLA